MKKPTKPQPKFRWLLLIVLLLSAAGGIWLAGHSKAATPFVAAEAERGTVTAPAAVATDSTASNQSAVTFSAASSPSGQAIPVGNISGWRQSYSQDFKTAAPTGQFNATYANSWCPYDDAGKYFNSRVLSAHDGLMDFKLDGLVGGAGWFDTGPACASQTYGRFSIRFKAVNAAANGTAIMVWPSSNIWGDGELDYPEGNFDGTIGLYHHPMNCTDCSSSDGLSTGASWQSWHTATVEWLSSGVKYYLDGALIKTVTHDIPTTKHRFTIQMAPNGTNPQPGDFLIDWVTMYTPA